jgi:dTDP-4-dehydrorhamnose 3,5-epimerase-like enzyme
MLKPKIVELVSHSDDRGFLSVLSPSYAAFPSEIKRIYVLHHSNPKSERGGHAHPNLWQLILCTSGTVTIEVATPNEIYTYELSQCDKALIIPPGYWRTLYNFTPKTVLVVLADKDYEETVYIRNFDKYIDWYNSNAIKNWGNN